MSTYIFTDTTADYSEEFASKEKDFAIMPMPFSLDGDNYDNIETKLPIKEFYKRMRAGAVSHTSMVPTYVMEQMFTEQLEKGNDVLYIAVSSNISGCYNGAVSVIKQLKDKYPDRKLEAIDSLLASGGESLLLYNTLRKRDEGMAFDALVKYASDLRQQVCSYFTVMDLKHLARMGRVSNAMALIGTALKIMPTMYVNAEGKLIPIGKVISRKKALKFLLNKMEEKMLDVSKQGIITMTQSDCLEDAEIVKKEIEEKYHLPVYISDIGPIIGGHTNAGCVALFFLSKNRDEIDDTNKK